MGGGLIGRALVITLPGSLQAVKECFGIFIEGLPKAIMMIEKQGRKGPDKRRDRTRSSHRVRRLAKPGTGLGGLSVTSAARNH